MVFCSGLPPSERLVLLALVDHMPNCEPSLARLVQWTGLSEKTIRLCLKSLAQKGLLTAHGSNGRRSTYVLYLANLGNDDRGNSYRGSDGRGSDDRTPRYSLPGTPVMSTAKGSKEGSKEGSGALSLNSNSSKGETPKAPKAAKPRRGTLSHFAPDDFGPLDGHRAKATELGVDLGRELDAFRAYEFRTPKSDWDRAFHNWLTRAADYANGRATASAPRPAVAADAGLRVIRSRGDLR